MQSRYSSPSRDGLMQAPAVTPARRPQAPDRRSVLACCLALAGLLTALVAGAQALEVIELRHRLADEIIPIVEPLLEPGGVVTGMDGTLFVRTSAANLEQIRRVVESLDRPPRQLLVSVGQGTVTNLDSSAARGSATIGSGDVQAGINRPPGADTGLTVRADGRSQRTDLSNVSTVRALEGMETRVATGLSVPVATTQVTRSPGGSFERQTTEFREASTGFYVIARLNGDDVTLTITPRQQRLRPTPLGPAVETAGAVTTVRGRLGEWLPIGSVQASSESNTGGLLTRGQLSTSSRYATWVKVDELP